MLKKNKDIGEVVRLLYNRYYNLSRIERNINEVNRLLYNRRYNLGSRVDDDFLYNMYLSKSNKLLRTYNKIRSKEIRSKANICAMIKISHLLDDNNCKNSNFSYIQCSPITKHCVNIINWTQKQEKLSKRDKKQFEFAKKILPYLYKNMKADRYSTMEAYAERKKELQEAGLDTSMLDNFKNQIVKKQEEKNM